MILTADFFNQNAERVARQLLGKILRVKYKQTWLAAVIIETEVYLLEDKASHASLGFTSKRKALFMPPGTIYMYYARGGDSLNISCQGEGNAVLIKSAYPYIERNSLPKMISIMQKLNPLSENKQRTVEQLCKGQTLLCKSLGLKVPDWDQQQFDKNKFYIDDIGLIADKIVQTKRLGIPKGRDEHLLYRFIDYNKIKLCTSNPLTKKCFASNKDYFILEKC
ncbi:MAG: 3-methyladenine DNA glycosylase [Gammaproteobacteria bacterium RIFCSPHIGHO2_12_FULL_35_23]|nr:MAG: 3-methyladenine DNA glycosylase [Gammaproteobacteria bacterium RIFCSPHIGHO2_12_FULL_35_23]